MNFPKDQELFKDIRSDGTLDPSKFPKGRKTAKQAFYDEVLRHRNDPLSVWYKDSRSGDEEEKKEEPEPDYYDIRNAADSHGNLLFYYGENAGFEQAKSGYIGEFPDGTVHGGTYCSDDENAVPVHVSFHISTHMDLIRPLNTGIEKIRELYKNAVTAKKERHCCLVGVLFLLLHMAVIVVSALPLLSGMERFNWFGHGWDWVIVIGGCLLLVLAWTFHNATANQWSVLGFIHLVCTLVFLLMQVQKFSAPGDRLFAAGLTLIVSLISVIHYLSDGLGKYVRSRIAEFKNWCDHEALEDYRRLRYSILWYKNVIGEKTTPFDTLQKEFLALCEKRSEF